MARAERVAVGNRAAFGLQNLRVGQLKLLVRVRRDREDAGLEEIESGVFQEAGVALASDDLVVDASGLGARAHLADEPAVAVPDGELRDRGRLGDGEEVRAFECGVRVVAEDLLDVRGCDLRVDFSVNGD